MLHEPLFMTGYVVQVPAVSILTNLHLTSSYFLKSSIKGSMNEVLPQNFNRFVNYLEFKSIDLIEGLPIKEIDRQSLDPI